MHQDGLYVYWHLEHKTKDDEIKVTSSDKNVLLNSAYQLLALNRPEYIFHFYGTEVTQHPHFLELFRYIQTSGRNVKIISDSDKSQEVSKEYDIDKTLVFLEDEESFSCVGCNCVEVKTDGQCTLGLVENDLPFMPQVLKNVKLIDALSAFKISFTSQKEAEQYLDSFILRCVHYEIEGGPIRSPMSSEITLEQIIRGHLRWLKMQSQSKQFPCCPQLWLQHKADIMQCYTYFHDTKSQNVYLSRIKAYLYGNRGYLAQAYNDDPLIPNYPCILLDHDIEINQISPRLLHIQYYKLALKCIFPDQSIWFNILLILVTGLEEYEFFIRQEQHHTILYAQAKIPLKHYLAIPPRTQDNVPLISLILYATSDGLLLQTTFESLLSQNLKRYEIIIVYEADNYNLTMLVDDYVCRNPRQIRSYRIKQQLSCNSAWSFGLEMAQGEYLCFLCSGDLLNADIMSYTIQIIEEMNADVVMVDEYIDKTRCVNNDNAIYNFMHDNVTGGLRNKLYKALILQKYCGDFARFQNNTDNDLINFNILNNACKIVYICKNLLSNLTIIKRSNQEIIFDYFTEIYFIDLYHKYNSKEQEIIEKFLLYKYKKIEKNFIEFISSRSFHQIQDMFVQNNMLEILIKYKIFAYFISQIDSKSLSFLQLPSPIVSRHKKKCTILGQGLQGQTNCLLSCICILKKNLSDSMLTVLLKFIQSENEIIIICHRDLALSEQIDLYRCLYANMIVIFANENTSITECIDNAIHTAHGEFIRICDFSKPVQYETTYNFLENINCECAICDIKFYNLLQSKNYNKTQIYSGIDLITYFYCTYKQIILDNLYFKKEIIEQYYYQNCFTLDYKNKFISCIYHLNDIYIIDPKLYNIEMREYSAIDYDSVTDHYNDFVLDINILSSFVTYYQFLEQLMKTKNIDHNLIQAIQAIIQDSIHHNFIHLYLLLYEKYQEKDLLNILSSLPKFTLYSIIVEYTIYNNIKKL